MPPVSRRDPPPPRPSPASGGGGRTLRTPRDIAAAGLVDPARLPALEQVAARFAVAVTPAMQALIDPADPADPIARQFVPDERELAIAPEELGDPIGDAAHSPVPGIVHRYPDRVLLMPTTVCAVYCRFCFRRETVGPATRPLGPAALARAFDYIRARPEIWEVIVTGGDPFVLSPRRLGAIVRTLAAIPHVAVIRFHTRVPAVDPARITPALVAALDSDKAVYVVLHADHPRELTPAAKDAVGRLARAGIALLSQTVLLAGINDDAATLEALFRGLVAMRVKPYYLHHPDLARGTGHFRLPIAAGQALMRELRGRVSGLCQPTYVLDIPGGHGKVPIGPCYVAAGSETGELRVEDFAGASHSYGRSATSC